MAQRTIHYLFGDIISDQIELNNKERFLLGNIIPDAVDVCDRDKSHFIIKTDSHVYFDFEMFRNNYHELMLQDDLYLGYYMHLVEDAFYRVFIYNNRFSMPRTQEEVRILHNDYHILNSYIVKKYGICNMFENDIALAHEPICNIATFVMRQFLDEMAFDFTEQTEGNTVFLTENMLDDFIETYIPLAIDELKNIKKGTSILKASDYAWLRKR